MGQSAFFAPWRLSGWHKKRSAPCFDEQCLTVPMIGRFGLGRRRGDGPLGLSIEKVDPTLRCAEFKGDG